jgi:hypothetical protein
MVLRTGKYNILRMGKDIYTILMNGEIIKLNQFRLGN